MFTADYNIESTFFVILDKNLCNTQNGMQKDLHFTSNGVQKNYLFASNDHEPNEKISDHVWDDERCDDVPGNVVQQGEQREQVADHQQYSSHSKGEPDNSSGQVG